MNGVIDYLPNPTEIDNLAYERFSEDGKFQEREFVMENDAKKQFISFAFKLEENKYGQLTFCRAY